MLNKEEQLTLLEDAAERIDEAIEMLYQFCDGTGDDVIRRTIIADLEILRSNNHSWLGGGSGYNLQDYIDMIESGERW